ncbi:hypothetical protein L3X39_11155 [Sabulilitoribacter multivorans]|uniref:Uncharacterized protein n=1 Tax=Flaviramulus multivorans TaxID=1304750 RepID=A0ABS9IKS3_9FLAO|nr:hypothetical protein [Flaviramulus multivorans]MCF7561196.1 hypothetical protein [Flaviramulus multivorans]
MRKIVFILIILIFQQNLYSQKEIIGKVEFYKSEATKFALFRDTDDRYTKNLNKRKSKIQLFQRDSLTELETDSLGIFKIRISLKDSIKIKINEHSPFFNGQFEFGPKDIVDTLKLRISDRKLAIQRDSVLEPEFQNIYSEQKAKIDFKAGKRNILLVGYDWPTDETTQRREEIAKMYKVDYVYIFEPSQSKMRIIYRYNQVMRKLMGIKKNVW